MVRWKRSGGDLSHLDRPNSCASKVDDEWMHLTSHLPTLLPHLSSVPSPSYAPLSPFFPVTKSKTLLISLFRSSNSSTTCQLFPSLLKLISVNEALIIKKVCNIHLQHIPVLISIKFIEACRICIRRSLL